jgi:4-hydroxy-tetrahydrodipicolinate synthase
MIEYKIAAPNIAIYCGDDYLMPAMGAEGAVGLISIASNAWPEAVRHYVEKSLHGKLEDDESKIWWSACKEFVSASNPIPIKALLKEIDLIEHDIVRLPLCRDDFQSIEKLISYNGMIKALTEKYHG